MGAKKPRLSGVGRGSAFAHELLAPLPLGSHYRLGENWGWCQAPVVGALPTLFLVLPLPGLDRLPLHVARSIWTACAQRNNVVHHVALARAALRSGGWAGVGFAEGVFLGWVAFRFRVGGKTNRHADKQQGGNPMAGRRHETVAWFNLQPQCLHTRASFNTDSAQSGQRVWVAWLGPVFGVSSLPTKAQTRTANHPMTVHPTIRLRKKIEPCWGWWRALAMTNGKK